ncbi:MAG: IS110 family transposase, partial [Deltaproteobacteria bacterium]|nr:IS110 family transposase [Deltaproteobacteria bacterium]
MFNFFEDLWCQCILLEPRSVRMVTGRKTDMSDCMWIRRIVACGLPSECFVPTKEFSALRRMLRTCAATVRERSSATNRIVKCLREANINLENAVIDVTGKTGMSIIKAILGGERDPLVLAELRDDRCKTSRAEIARCLDGVYTASTVIILGHHVKDFESKSELLDALDEKIVGYLDELELPLQDPEDASAARASRTRKRSTLKDQDRVWTQLVRLCGGVDLTKIPGISVLLALVNVLEIGTDMTRFPTVKHFASWPGLSPCPKESGGKVISSATRKVRGPAAHAFIMAGKCVGRTDTVFGDFYRKLRTKDGPMKALTVVAHKIARAVFAMLRNGARYTRESGAEREK